jgi:3D (Asp-Asp-Asp) domain-containing protein
MRISHIFVSILLLFCFLPINTSGECIEGDCEDGHGTYTSADGTKYEGGFRHGKYHGRGSLSAPALHSILVKVTAYPPTRKHCDDTPLITASGKGVRRGIVALSRDLEEDFDLKFGDLISLEGWGLLEFQDRMNKRWKRRVDVFVWTVKEAVEIGIRESRLYLLR